MTEKIQKLSGECDTKQSKVEDLDQEIEDIVRQHEEKRNIDYKAHEDNILDLKNLIQDYKAELENLLSTPQWLNESLSI